MTWNDPLTWQNPLYSEVDRVDWFSCKCEGNPVRIPTDILGLLSAQSPQEATRWSNNLAGRVVQSGEIAHDSAIPCITCIMTYFAKSSDLVRHYILRFLVDATSPTHESEIVTACLREIERGIHDLFAEISHGIHKNKIYATEIVTSVCLASSDKELLKRALWYIQNFGVDASQLLLTTSIEKKKGLLQQKLVQFDDYET